ncbi:unnamed protein product [Toxocara canis]|uniref:Uncharacterized protein n=1 Tax=Toxocara canis TaxID=6265 RepID=A0A183UHT6_TOXCA|nr:unnamed protein product [Toxocara canis]
MPSLKDEPKKSRKDVPRASPTSTSDEDDDGSSERKGGKICFHQIADIANYSSDCVGSSAAKSDDKKTAQSRKAAGISTATRTTASDCSARTINDISIQDKQLQPDERLLDASNVMLVHTRINKKIGECVFAAHTRTKKLSSCIANHLDRAASRKERKAELVIFTWVTIRRFVTSR